MGGDHGEVLIFEFFISLLLFIFLKLLVQIYILQNQLENVLNYTAHPPIPTSIDTILFNHNQPQ